MQKPIWKYSELAKLLKRDFPLVRRWAFEKLTELYGSSRHGTIAGLIDDADEYISAGAIRFLADRGYHRWAFRILRKFQDSSGIVAGNCASALGKLGYREAVPFFRQKIESGEADYETLAGIITVLGQIPCPESTDLLLSINMLYSNAKSGTFIARIADALLETKERNALDAAINLYMERAFSLDDKGNGMLQQLIKHTDSFEFIDEFHSFVAEQPFDVLRYIRENVRHRLGEILGEQFVARTSEKFLKTNYRKLLADIRQTGEIALYTRRIVSGENGIENGSLNVQGIFNYEIIQRFACESRLLNVMSLGEIKKVIILCISALLRIVYPRKSGTAEVEPDDILNLMKMLDSAVDPDEIIRRIVASAGSSESASEHVKKIASGRLKRQETARHPSRYITLLTRLCPSESIELFWDSLDLKHDDNVCRAAEEGMVAAGQTAVDFIASRFSTGDESQKMFSLGVLSRIPVPMSVKLVLKSIDPLWDEYRDFILYAVNELGSRKFLNPMMRKLGEALSGNAMNQDKTVEHEDNILSDIEETCLLLCELHGIHYERLSKAKERIIAELQRASEGEEIKCDRTKALRMSHCNRKLICRHCDLGYAASQ